MRQLFIVLVIALSSPAHAQHLASRLQWQPETIAVDARLDQPVEIEIIGRAAVPAMQMLSEKTGVSLGVAPEDLNTVGERKLTIMSKGLSLKALMVQLPEALQEAHWDVDASGEQPVYVLHRNGSAEQTMKWLEERDAARQAEKQRAERVNRMEEAERALEMPSEELAELEKTDPLLARSVRDLHSRDLLEILLTLPPDQAGQFQDTGKFEIDYAQAPERWQQATQRIAEWYVVRWGGEQLPEKVRNWRDHLGHATIGFSDNRVEHGWGVWLSLDIPNEGSSGPAIHDVALQPRYCNLDEGQPCYTRLLVATGVPDEETAFQMVIARDKEGFRASDANREERHKRDWIEPTDPDLLQTVVLGDAKYADFAQLQAIIADKTGLPIVSDCFTLSAPYLSEDVRKGIPLWRLLYIIGEDDFRNEDVYCWRKRGNCLVFHRADWPALAKSEVPEWVIVGVKHRLENKDKLDIDDLSELAVTLDSLGLTAAQLPRDLQKAGSYTADSSRWALLLYASLTTEQKGRIVGPDGLSFDDMTVAQRAVVRDRAAKRSLPLGMAEAQKATFALVQSTEERRGRRFEKTELQLRFPSVTDSALVGLKVVAPQEAPSG